jgi:hypothetical protein
VSGVPGRPHRNLRWLWIVVPIATIVSIAILVIGLFTLYSGYFSSPPSSFIYGKWTSSQWGDEEIEFLSDGTFVWTVSHPDSDPTFTHGTWKYDAGFVDLQTDSGPITDLFLQRHLFQGGDWSLFDLHTSGEAFDFTKVEGSSDQ